MNKDEIKREKAIDEDPIWDHSKKADLKTEYTKNQTDLYKLSDLDDYEVDDNDPDVRGWEIHLTLDKIKGKVDDLIVDPKRMKVRYLVGEFNNLPQQDGRKWILIPIGKATLDEKENIVYLPKVRLTNISSSPSFEGSKISRDYEHALRKTLSDQSEAEERSVGEFYEHDDFDDRIFYGSRRTHSSQVDNSKFRR